jgi:hypothetical protein
MKKVRLSVLGVSAFLILCTFQLNNLASNSSVVRKHSARSLEMGMPLLFEENRGQTFAEVDYLARGKGYLLLLSSQEVLWLLQSQAPGEDAVASTGGPVVVRLRWLNGSSDREPRGEQTVPTRTSYFKGTNPSEWIRALSNHRAVRYEEIYPGIDLVFYGKDGRLEYDFLVSPGADPGQIQLSFTGMNALRLGSNGDLVLETSFGEMRHTIPHIYQEFAGERREVTGRFRLEEDGVVTFEVDSYNPELALTIDPVLVYSTYLGGSESEVPGSVAVDSEGHLYVIGSTGSADFPLHNPFQDEFAGGGATLGDVYVTKIDASGSSILYSTYIGGAGTDVGRGIAVNALGQVVGTGTTFSTDFPSTPGSFQPACSGQCPFVFQLTADGSQLRYGTFVGRGDGLAVALDNLGQAVLTGKTSSTNFPVKDAFQMEKSGGFDAFVSKLNGNGSDLIFSTFLGGSDSENLIGKADVATDMTGGIYVTGRTRSDDFPTLNPIQAGFQGGEDAFVSKLDPQGALVYSTYLGGSGDDVGQGICTDQNGSAYVTGNTESLDFPTVAAFQPDFGGGSPIGDAFVAKIAPAGGALAFSTYLGGQAGDTAADIALDSLGQVVVVGNGSSNFPVHQALRSFDGIDNYVAKFSADGSEVVYSTPIGGGDADISVATFGTNVYAAGNIAVANLPILNALQPRSAGFTETFLTQISDAGSLSFAHFGNGTGAVSDILLTNSSAVSSSSATVLFRGGDGLPISVGTTVSGDEGGLSFRERASELELTVPPLGVVKITTDGEGDIVVGSVTVAFDIPLGGVVRFNLTPFGIAGVNQSELVRGFITPVRRSLLNPINTGVAVHNPEGVQVGLTLRLRDKAGVEIPGGLTTMALPAGGHLARFIDELFPSADTEEFEGTLTVEVGTFNALITATALELGSQAGQFTTLPVTPLP